jgi:hypothetical protein
MWRGLAGHQSALRKMLDSIGPNSATAKMLDSIGPNSATAKMLDSVLSRPSFAAMVGAYKPVDDLFTSPAVASFVGRDTMSPAAWSPVLDGLRPAIGEELYDDASIEFESASEVAGDSDGATWWVFRLPLHTQLVLLVASLAVLDKMSEFLGDLTGEDVPPAYRSGTQVVFALAALLSYCIGARMEAAKDAPPESDD